MARSACLAIAGAVWLCSLGLAAPVAAQDASQASFREAVEGAAAQLSALPAPTLFPAPSPHEQRPSALVPLYLSFAALQVLDVHSTQWAMDRGAVEANPVMKGLVHSELALIGGKAAGTAAVVYASERMWKKNRMASVLFMVAANSAMAWVVQHNYGTTR